MTSALVNAFLRLDYDLSVEAQVHLSTSSTRSSFYVQTPSTPLLLPASVTR